MKFRYIVYGALAALCLSLYSIKSAASAEPFWLLAKKRGNIVRLTRDPEPRPPGATGFEFQAPSGITYTVTNGHVCDLAKGGFLYAWPNTGSEPRAIKVRVIEQSKETDLCILEGLPGARGEKPAQYFEPEKPLHVVGHPGLRPLTLSSGEFSAPDVVEFPFDERPLDQCLDPKFRLVEGTCVFHALAYMISARVYPGNSGSPVFNDAGDVIGVAFATEGFPSFYGLMVPLDDLKKFVSVY